MPETEDLLDFAPPSAAQEEVFSSYVYVYNSIRDSYFESQRKNQNALFGWVSEWLGADYIADFDAERDRYKRQFYQTSSDSDRVAAIRNMEALIDAARATFGTDAQGNLDPQFGGEDFRVNQYHKDDKGNVVFDKGAKDLKDQLKDDADKKLPPVTSIALWGLFGVGLVVGGVYLASRAGYLPKFKVGMKIG